MEIVLAEKEHIYIVKHIAQKTITDIYPRYYPAGAVEFFINHHCEENIADDVKNNLVYLLMDNGQYVGTVTIKDNEICRLFVLPENQHMGLGKKLLDFAEKTIFDRYSDIIIDASLSAKKIYLLRGYKETEYHLIQTDNGDILCYDVMHKIKI